MLHSCGWGTLRYSNAFELTIQRACVLQECLLGSGVLCFGHKQLVWGCNELCVFEMFPEGLPPGVPRNMRQQSHARVSAMAPKSGLITKEREREALGIWRSMVTLYRSSHLTFGTEKLRALAGIVKHIQPPLFGNTYMGTWLDFIVLLLLWYCLRGNGSRILPRPVERRAPTWSWA